MCLAELGVDFLCLRVEGVAIGGKGCLHHADAAFGEDAALQRRVCLQTNDHLAVFVDIACSVGVEALRQFGFCVVDSLFSFHLEHFAENVPQFVGAGCRTGKEGLITVVGLIVVLNKVTYVDFMLPGCSFEVCL